MDVSASALAELNDKRKFKSAARLYKEVCHRTRHHPSCDAAFHYQGFLALSMINETVALSRERLEKCPDYDDLMKADLKRDLARQIMRPHNQPDYKLAEAYTLLTEAAQAHASLSLLNNRDSDISLLAPEQLTARVHYWADMASLARHDYIKEHVMLGFNPIVMAIAALDGLRHVVGAPSETTTYLCNAAFDGLRTATRLHFHRDAANFAGLVIELDPSWKKRWVARVIRYGGPWALVVIERFFR